MAEGKSWPRAPPLLQRVFGLDVIIMDDPISHAPPINWPQTIF